MNLSASIRRLVSDETAAAGGSSARCEAANFRWESAVSSERAAGYDSYVGDVAAHTEWRAEHKGYVASHAYVPKDLPRSAECFMAVGRESQLGEDLDNAYLLRLEAIDHLSAHPLISDLVQAFWERFFNSQKDLRKTTLSERDEDLRSEFVTQWNELRTQARPSFATFLNDFGGNLERLTREDWPHILRDRLGLMHWPSTPGKPLPVVLMCYTTDYVRQARSLQARKGATASFCRPTVLDLELSSAFVPGALPLGKRSYGFTLDLANPDVPEAFTPELLTYPIEYSAAHIKALGFISREHALQDGIAVLAARNRHVQGVRQLPACSGFGEVLL